MKILCGPVMMASGVAVGLLMPAWSAILAPYLGPMMAVVLYGTILRTDMAVVLGYLRRPTLPLLAMGCIFIVSPLLMLATAWLPIPATWRACLLLNSATPPILGGPAAAIVLGLDVELALIGMVGGTILAPLSLTLAGWFAPSGGFDADPWKILLRVSLYTLVPLVLALATRAMFGPQRLEKVTRRLPCLLVLGLSIIAIGLMDGANQILARGWDVTWPILLLALAYNLGHQALFYGLMRMLGLGLRTAGIIAIIGGNRNIGTTQAGLGNGEDGIFAAYVALCQIPIYLTPMLWRSLILPALAKIDRNA